MQGRPWNEAKIYAAEAVTSFALRMRGIFPKFIGSEYATSEEQKAYLFPIPHEDLTALSFPDDVFDIVITNEVLEHVPSIDLSLKELHRVLKPGGWHIGTHPFYYGQDESVIRAKIEDGVLIHLMEPEWHGNPVSEKGALVFEVPGWDILSRARAAGFTDAHIKFLISSEYGCLASDSAGIMLLCLRK